MINNFKNKTTNFIGIGVFTAVLLCFSCEDTDLVETYKQYVPENVVSLAMPDSVSTISSGHNKLLFRVFVNSDPKIKKVVIALFDDDLTDNDEKILKTLDINRTVYEPEIYELEAELPEGGNEYFVHIEGLEGRKSIKYDVFGTVLGDEYKESLQARQNSGASAYSDSEAIITWVSNKVPDTDGEVIDNLLVKTELTYISSTDGAIKTIVIDESEDETIIPDFISEGTYTYTTFYKAVVDSPYLFESNSTEGVFPEKI
ncbi:DUF4998 domain-containing protein [Algibacter sp. Ld11]|uniref:DUF4998 domain-containing protein n=1 Tax=Algibacter sp. Ld11 TaxID=649150 RepID=UPI0038708F4A